MSRIYAIFAVVAAFSSVCHSETLLPGEGGRHEAVECAPFPDRLSTLVIDPKYPEFGEGSAARIAALNKLVARVRRIGYECSNHYFYIPQDIVEKVVLCCGLAR